MGSQTFTQLPNSDFYEGGPPQKALEFIYKICAFTDAIHPSRHFFFLCSNQFWTCQFWCLLVLLLFFVSSLPHQQNVSLWGHFSSGETKRKVACSEIRWIGRVGHGGYVIFGQKLLNTQCSMSGCTLKSHALKQSSTKNSLKPSTASHHNASWYTDTGGFLEHSTGGSLYYKGPALQKIISILGGPTSYVRVLGGILSRDHP